MTPAGDVTGLLQAWTRGDQDALAELASLVHYELRQMAKRMLSGERAAYAWQPTELINESYLPAAARLARCRMEEPRALLRRHGQDDARGAR